MGLLCSHSLEVFKREDVTCLDGKYVVDRWKKANKREKLVVPDFSLLESDVGDRYISLCRIVNPIIEDILEYGYVDEDASKEVVTGLVNFRNKLHGICDESDLMDGVEGVIQNAGRGRGRGRGRMEGEDSVPVGSADVGQDNGSVQRNQDAYVVGDGGRGRVQEADVQQSSDTIGNEDNIQTENVGGSNRSNVGNGSLNSQGCSEDRAVECSTRNSRIVERFASKFADLLFQSKAKASKIQECTNDSDVGSSRNSTFAERFVSKCLHPKCETTILKDIVNQADIPRKQVDKGKKILIDIENSPPPMKILSPEAVACRGRPKIGRNVGGIFFFGAIVLSVD